MLMKVYFHKHGWCSFYCVTAPKACRKRSVLQDFGSARSVKKCDSTEGLQNFLPIFVKCDILI